MIVGRDAVRFEQRRQHASDIAQPIAAQSGRAL
jgi:hypothetical protein